MKIKSDFQDILPEDCKQYNDIAKRYLAMNSESYAEAFDLMQQSWALAQRWSELQASSSKIAAMDGVDVLKTAFKEWCYQRYRQMQLIHESCRVIWRQGNEHELYLKRQTQ